MGAPPDDLGSRQDSLEGWLAEQRRMHQRPAPNSWRSGGSPGWVELKVALMTQRLASRLLDRDVDTSSHVWEPVHDHPDRVQYIPSAWHVLPRALRYLGVSERDTFIDFGCGKGRVLHQAAKRPFRRVIGVEISPILAEIARANLTPRRRRYRCGDIEIVVSDVAEYQVPDDLTIGYFYSPFKDETCDYVLTSIIDSMDRQPRRVRLIYLLPIQKSKVLATGRFRLLTEQRSRVLDLPGPPAAIFESC